MDKLPGRMRMVLVLLGMSISAAAQALDFAAEREERFMQACMRDATVAAGQRQVLCACVRDEFAYGGRTSFGLTDVLALDERDWEAPDRRLPRDSLGQEIRRIRQACLKAPAGPRPAVR
ncbi:MAG: hypothetical protein VW625_09320 [Perlucidibaca sp.]